MNKIETYTTMWNELLESFKGMNFSVEELAKIARERKLPYYNNFPTALCGIENEAIRSYGIKAPANSPRILKSYEYTGVPIKKEFVRALLKDMSEYHRKRNIAKSKNKNIQKNDKSQTEEMFSPINYIELYSDDILLSELRNITNECRRRGWIISVTKTTTITKEETL